MKALAEFESCAKRLKALADPERLRIINLLFEGPRHVSDLADLLHDEIVKVSHHLGVLRKADLVQTRKEGRFVQYMLHPDVLRGPQSAASAHTIELGCCRLELPPASAAAARSVKRP
ncbi:MAG TPA: metalloregulator ArsR/SmtB family transcription factor [Pirellulales bacterium]|jgi:DNA-binding transcriptional ArsR family regulator|nr:metalloregulator ArsR/SmtB family transcription factor [Pirellulales bacterium]